MDVDFGLSWDALVKIMERRSFEVPEFYGLQGELREHLMYVYKDNEKYFAYSPNDVEKVGFIRTY